MHARNIWIVTQCRIRSAAYFRETAFVALLILALGAGMQSALATVPKSLRSGHAHMLELAKGIASVYSDRFEGRKTASGEAYDRYALTAAHRTLPLGTRIKVTNISTRRSITVRINDRGPFRPGRIVDLSPRAAVAIGMPVDGLANVQIQVVSRAGPTGSGAIEVNS